MRPKTFCILAAIAVSAMALAKPDVVPSLLQTSASTDVVFNATGGWLSLSIDKVNTGGWDQDKAGPRHFDDVHIMFLQRSAPMDFVAKCFANPQGPPPTFGFSLTSPLDRKLAVGRNLDGWMLTEVTFPECDVDSTTPDYMRLTLAGGTSQFTGIQPWDIKKYPLEAKKQKQWLPSNFRLEIGGLPCQNVSKIDAYTVKQSLVDLNGDGVLDANLSSSDFVFTLPAADAQPMVDFLAKGASGGSQVWPTPGYWVFLDASGNTLNTLVLEGMIPISVEPVFDPLDAGVLKEKITIRPERHEIA